MNNLGVVRLLTRAVLCVAVWGVALMAQQTAAIRGTLTDSSGAAIPGATVSLSSATVQRSSQAGPDGAYVFVGLAPGPYTLKVDYPGLESFVRTVEAEATRTLDVPIQLRLRVTSEAVTVNGERTAELSLDPTQSASAKSVSGSDLDALPDNPDDLQDMLMVLAGPGSNALGGAQILIDGFNGGKLPPKNTIKEIKIDQNRFSADKQWGWGGQIEIVTKPGADKLHGTLGLTDSDAFFNSRNPYAANKADYVNRMFTVNLGDSIKNRASYTLDFYQNTINNTALINAVTLNPLTLADTPVRSTVVVPRNDVSGTGRLDYQISTNHTFTGSYRYLRSSRDNNGVGQYSLESRGFPSENSTGELRMTETAVLSTRVVTETRLASTRNSTQLYGGSSSPSINVVGAFNGGPTQTGQTSNTNNRVEVQSNTTVTRGTHVVRFGGTLHHIAIEDSAPTNFAGTFSFFGVTNAPVLDANHQPMGDLTAPIGSLEQYRRTLLFEGLGYSPATIRSLGGGASQFSIAAGNPVVKFGQTDVGFYALDDWKLRPNLTISAGLRYETQTNIHDATDFGPRLAFAWSPGAKTGTTPKTVFRIGAGEFYIRFDNQFVQQSKLFNGIAEQQYTVQNPDFYPNIPPVTSLAGGQSSTTYRLDPHLHALAEFLAVATVERQLPWNTSISASYSDQRTSHHVQLLNINAPLPGTYIAGQSAGVRPLGASAGNILQYETGGTQKVNWAEVHVNSKLKQKHSISVNYSVWNAHNNGGWDNLTPSNPYNYNADWSRAAWNGEWAQNLNIIGTIMAPKGIQLSPFFIANSGQPYDLTIGSDLNGDTVANDRPAFATDLSRPSVVFTKFGAFDTNPMPGQTIVPRNYLTAAPMWNLNLRMSKTFGFGEPKDAPPAGYKGPAQHRYGLNFNIDVINLFNHLVQGGWVGDLSSPLFGQSTAIGLWQSTSNNRRVQFGTQFTF